MTAGTEMLHRSIQASSWVNWHRVRARVECVILAILFVVCGSLALLGWS